GPDVFRPDAMAHAKRKIEICRRYGIEGLAPLNQDVAPPAEPAAARWQTVFDKDVAMMEACDCIIANLTPFGGASADAGTLIEVGWFLGRGKPIFAYSNTRASFEERMRRQLALAADDADCTMAIEGFHLPDNLMIVGAVMGSGYPIIVPNETGARDSAALDVFEACVANAAAAMAVATRP
ncbi:MAG: nucleoside 2-deoxyribosyltransferase, partial [Tardiphaga sp.]